MEVPFKLNQINPLDQMSWRSWSSLPFPLAPCQPGSTAEWTNDRPINCSGVHLLDRVYSKLDETTEFKNDLVKALLKLREEHEGLKKTMREMLESNNKE